MDKVAGTRILRDLAAGLVVFFVAIPLCLGIALASNAPLISGIIAGVVGGVVVGLLSGAHLNVAGPAAGLAAVVASQIHALGSLPAFGLAIVIAGGIQILMGLARAGSFAAFFPSGVIKGLLAAIGILLILKQVPHLVGHDTDPEGDWAFLQMDAENTISELGETIYDLHPGAATIGLLSLGLLFAWNQVRPLKRSPVPSSLLVVFLGLCLAALFRRWGAPWAIQPNHMVQVPVLEGLGNLSSIFSFPDWSRISDPKVYTAAVTLAVVASIETLINTEAVEKLDPLKRNTPSNRELIAQGCGNITSGLLGGLPVTAVIVRSSVNVTAGARTKLSTIFHGVLLAVCVVLAPRALNQIPLACLAAILFHTGLKLVSPSIFRRMWRMGWTQFLPFVVTIIAIVTTDLLKGVVIGMLASFAFILRSNLRHPLRTIQEKHLGGDVLRIELANQVSFLNRAALSDTLDTIPANGHVLLDARHTDYIDPDVLDMIRDYEREVAPARKVQVSLTGFEDQYKVRNHTEFVDYSNRDIQRSLKPEEVLQLFRDGNERFRSGKRLTRDLTRQVGATADGQFPLAVILTCIDSRTPTELIFDLGVGDSFTIRIAGNVAKDKVLGSMEYACSVAGAKLVLVMGHTRCGAVGAAVDLFTQKKTAYEATQCEHLDAIVGEIQKAIEPARLPGHQPWPAAERERIVDGVARSNVRRTMQHVRSSSRVLNSLVEGGKIAIVGGLYDVRTGVVDFFSH